MRRELTSFFQGRRRLKRVASGLTLTEVVVASALLVVAVVPILKALTISHVTSTIIEQRTRSLTLAQAKLDDIRARSIYAYGSNFTENNTPLDGSYLCHIQDSASGTDLRQITVKVGFDGNANGNLQNSEVEVTLSTLVARRW
jgi:Tfp pilus assembly protein PilV